MRVAQTLVVIEPREREPIAALDDQFDRMVGGFRGADRILERLRAVGDAIHRDDLLSLDQPRLEGRAVPYDIRDGPFLLLVVYLDADREQQRQLILLLLLRALQRARCLGIDELVAAAPQPIERRRLAD